MYLVLYRKLDGSAPVALGLGANPRFSPDGTGCSAEMRQHISEALGAFDKGDSRWYGWLSEHLLRYGSEHDT